MQVDGRKASWTRLSPMPQPFIGSFVWSLLNHYTFPRVRSALARHARKMRDRTSCRLRAVAIALLGSLLGCVPRPADPTLVAKGSLLAFLLIAVVAVLVTVAWLGPPESLRRIVALGRRFPRLAATWLGIGLALLLLVTVEGALRAVAAFREEGRTVYSTPAFEHHPDLGYRPKAAVTTTATKLAPDGRIVYEVVYTMDREGRRVVPRSSSAPPRRAVAFFGCSFTFGEGLRDEETLPARYVDKATSDVAINFGVPGYGPNHILAILRSWIENPLPDLPLLPFGVYLFIDGHIGRAVGSVYVANRYGRSGPHFRLEDDGLVVRYGSHLSGRFFTSITYWALWRSLIFRELGFDWPPMGSPHSLKVTAGIIRAASTEFAVRTGGGRFYMVVYPGSRWGAEVGRQAGVTVLDYTELFDPLESGYLIEGDGHPSAYAVPRLAGRLAEDLAAPVTGREPEHAAGAAPGKAGHPGAG